MTTAILKILYSNDDKDSPLPEAEESLNESMAAANLEAEQEEADLEAEQEE